jgi:hypothetical protein
MGLEGRQDAVLSSHASEGSGKGRRRRTYLEIEGLERRRLPRLGLGGEERLVVHFSCLGV